MEECNKIEIQHICSNICSGGTPKSTIAEYYGGNIPWLNTKEINFNRIYKTEKTITDEGFNNSSAKWIPSNSVIVAMYGATAGKTAITQIPLTTNQACCNLTIDSTKADYRFVYYALCNNYSYLASLANGGAQQNLNAKQIKEFEIPFPSLREQKRIADILFSLDDKIELNRRINDNLEQQAQALFNYYFIDNRNKLGDYTESNLTQIATYLNGLAMQKYRPSYGEIGIPVLKIKELGQGFCDISSDLCSPSIRSEYIVNDGDIIFSWSGTLMIDTWCGGTCGLNQHLFKVNSELYPQWFIYFWTNHHLDKFIRVAKDKAVTMGHIKRSELVSSEVIIPNKTTLENLDKIFKPIFEESTSKKIENRKLEEVRNTLLSKLMSGELKINDLHS
ncbi:restriction endonuclease subunit S [Bacteroides intestinalis]|uniref:Restriction endonuclease subunit S n=1 Tax=Bacteroides intestinalis TaxID=329854 RepID=A0A412YII0_9BACE|nr:restriction endonuclease subunit S [Bacteroides intestinalis]RGV57237.1 restriction endonuclease subunit S [Bacteroides intestinalis]RHA61647.1 restriction endonuclease subunit S [Bacteroides intestinalis]